VFIYNNTAEDRQDRAFFGKAMVYSLAAAPFVWLLGMNGFLVFHVLMLFLVGACGYLFLAARSRPVPAMAFTLAFIGASVVPVYGVFLTSDLFNFTLVFVAYFLWLYKEVAQPRAPWLNSHISDVLAAILLGVVTYSKRGTRRWSRRWCFVLVAKALDHGFHRRRCLGRGGGAVVPGHRSQFGGIQLSGRRPQDLHSVPDDDRAARDPQAGFVFASAGDTWDVRGFSRGRDGGRCRQCCSAVGDRPATANQHQILPARTPLRVRSLLLSGSRGDCSLGHVTGASPDPGGLRRSSAWSRRRSSSWFWRHT
jgi:hypothetical protein